MVMLAVLDTSVVIAALRNPMGASGWWVRRAIRTGCGVVSVPLMLEYEDVTTRPDQLRAFGLTRRQVDATVARLCEASRQVSPSYSWRPILRDPDDDMVVEAALAGGARTVVTFNLRDFADAEGFGIQALRPREAMKSILANGD